jgi:cytidine deaminase
MVLIAKKNYYGSDTILPFRPPARLTLAGCTSVFALRNHPKQGKNSPVTPTPAQLKKLKIVAKGAAKRAYAPYSNFPVGAAVLTSSGRIYPGCNVENASYGLSNCAERTAIFSAVAAGEQQLKCVVVYTPTQSATAPCGACRQVIHEFGSEARVISFCAGRDEIDVSIGTLLPGAFGPQDLV